MIPKEINQWLSDNSTVIERGLQNQVPHVYSRQPHNLLLSDLRLCHGVSSIPTPPGHSHRVGTIIQHANYSPVYHEAQMSDSGQIIEYVPGQFFADESKGVSGKTQLLSVASHVVLLLSEQVFVAVGHKSELESLFDIRYFL